MVSCEGRPQISINLLLFALAISIISTLAAIHPEKRASMRVHRTRGDPQGSFVDSLGKRSALFPSRTFNSVQPAELPSPNENFVEWRALRDYANEVPSVIEEFSNREISNEDFASERQRKEQLPAVLYFLSRANSKIKEHDSSRVRSPFYDY